MTLVSEFVAFLLLRVCPETECRTSARCHRPWMAFIRLPSTYKEKNSSTSKPRARSTCSLGLKWKLEVTSEVSSLIKIKYMHIFNTNGSRIYVFNIAISSFWSGVRWELVAERWLAKTITEENFSFLYLCERHPPREGWYSCDVAGLGSPFEQSRCLSTPVGLCARARVRSLNPYLKQQAYHLEGWPLRVSLNWPLSVAVHKLLKRARFIREGSE